MASKISDANFINRERELRELRALVDRRQPGLGLLYGRRRVGKTYLLDHAFKEIRSFYFLAGETTAERNRIELLREIAPQLANSADADPGLFPSWRHVFRLFADLAENEPFVVILDEFQNLLNKEEDLASHLMAVWDREIRDRPLVIVACGSEVGTMRELESGAGPLYGRWNWVAKLRPFDHVDAGAMLPDLSLRDRALAFGMVGGTPRYLRALRSKTALSERIIHTVLSPRGETHVQLERIIEQEQGIRERAEYRAVLTAIAEGHTLIAEITASTGLQDRVHVVRRALDVLEGLGLIWRERNFGAAPKAPFRHRIADNGLRFWYRFAYPHRSRLELEEERHVWREFVNPQLDAYMGKVFEGMSRDAFNRFHRDWRLPAARHWARWEGRDRNRRSIELDIVAELDDQRVLTGEVKWSSRPIAARVHFELVRDLEDLASSGQGWAKDALAEERSGGHVYFSAAGFSDDFQELAMRRPTIRLIDLRSMY